MAITATQHWDKYYSENPFKRGKEPLPFLVKMKPRLQKGKVLDIGMGEGLNSIYLAKEGFSVKGFDVSQVAIDRALACAKEAGVTIDAKKADLDLFLMGIMEFDTIVMTYFKPALTRYYYEMTRSLKQGGTLLIESNTTEEMKEVIPGEESFRNFYFNSNEVLFHLKGLRILFYSESVENGQHIVQCLAQKPYDKDVMKYKLFDMTTNQKDSGPSAQQKLAEAFFKKRPE